MTSLIASLLGCLFVSGLDKFDLVDLCTPGQLHPRQGVKLARSENHLKWLV